MNLLKRIHLRLNKLNDFQFIILGAFFAYISLIPFSFLADFYEKFVGTIGGPSMFNDSNKLFVFTMAVILGPMAESSIIILIIRILKNKLKIGSNIRILILTSIIFSVLHYYSIFYMIVIFIPAVVFIYSYMYYEYKKLTPFWVMTSVHSLYNCIIFVTNFVS